MRDAQSDDSNVTPHVSIPVVRRVFKHEETLSVFNKKSLVSRDIINYKELFVMIPLLVERHRLLVRFFFLVTQHDSLVRVRLHLV